MPHSGQIPWPAGRRSQPSSPEPEHFRAPLPVIRTESIQSEASTSPAANDRRVPLGNDDGRVVKKHMSTMDLIALSISMAGAQIIWTMELGYGQT